MEVSLSGAWADMLMEIRGISVFRGLAAEVMLVECGVVIVVFDSKRVRGKQ